MVVAVTVVGEGDLHLFAGRVRQHGAELIAAPAPSCPRHRAAHDDRVFLRRAPPSALTSWRTRRQRYAQRGPRRQMVSRESPPAQRHVGMLAGDRRRVAAEQVPPPLSYTGSGSADAPGGDEQTPRRRRRRHGCGSGRGRGARPRRARRRLPPPRRRQGHSRRGAPPPPPPAAQRLAERTAVEQHLEVERSRAARGQCPAECSSPSAAGSTW